MDDIFREEGCW